MSYRSALLPVASGGTGVATLTGLALGSGTSAMTGVTYVAMTTWTPTIVGSTGAGTATYVTQVGYYMRIGNAVFATFTLNWNTGTGTGNCLIGGIPVAPSTATGLKSVGNIQVSGTLPPPATTCDLQVVAAGASSTTSFFIQTSNDAGGSGAVAYAASGIITGSLWYVV